MPPLLAKFQLHSFSSSHLLTMPLADSVAGTCCFVSSTKPICMAHSSQTWSELRAGLVLYHPVRCPVDTDYQLFPAIGLGVRIPCKSKSSSHAKFCFQMDTLQPGPD